MISPLGRSADDAEDTPVTVRLLQLPLKLWQRATEHHDELMREMALLALSDTKPELPHRLLELVEVLGLRYGASVAHPDAERDAAMARGLDRADITYLVPRSAAASAQRIQALLDEVEAYCRTHLLTLAQSPAQTDFGQWYIDQFVRQCAGHPPTPWPGPWS